MCFQSSNNRYYCLKLHTLCCASTLAFIINWCCVMSALLLQLGRFGEFIVSNGDLFAPTQVALPGAAALALQASQQYLRLDDGFVNQNPDPVLYPPPQLWLNNSLRVGASVASLFQGTVFQISASATPSFILVPTQPAGIVVDASTSPRPSQPPAPAPNTNVRVIAPNLLNLFYNANVFPTSRGASTAVEYGRQVTKIVKALAAMDAAVAGVAEIQNDDFGPTSTVADLTNRLNAQMGPGTYVYINPGYPKVGTDDITCKILYKPALVQPVGPLAVLDSSVDPQYASNNRPTQAQTFMLNSNGEKFTYVITHLKSKGSQCIADGDPDMGDGQGNCAGVRLRAAQAIVQWLATDPTGSGDPDFLVMGDLNAYRLEDAIRHFTDNNYTDLVHQYLGDGAYSYVFDGRKG